MCARSFSSGDSAVEKKIRSAASAAEIREAMLQLAQEHKRATRSCLSRIERLEHEVEALRPKKKPRDPR